MAPAQMQPPGAGGMPGAAGGMPGAKPPPFGQTSAMQPTANKGSEAAALQKLAMAAKLVGDAFSAAGATSELGQKIMKFLPKLTELVVPGASTPAGDKNQLEQMAMKNAQQNQMMQQFKQQQMAGQQGGASKPPMPQAAAA